MAKDAAAKAAKADAKAAKQAAKADAKAAKQATKADAKAAKQAEKSIKIAERTQFQNLKSSQRAEELALKATLKNSGLSGGALRSALRDERRANSAERDDARATLAQPGLQQLSPDGPASIRSASSTYNDDPTVLNSVNDIINRAAAAYTDFNLAPRYTKGNVTTGVGLDKLTKLELSRDPETGEYTKRSPLTKLLEMGDMYVGQQFTADDLANQNVKLKQDKNNPDLYKLVKGSDDVKNFVYFNKNPDGTFTGVGINRRVIEDTGNSFQKFMASDLGKALSIGAAVFAPQIGSYLFNLAPGTLGASIAGSSVIGGTKAALSGGDFTDIATAALTSGATTGVGNTAMSLVGDLATSMKDLVPFDSAGEFDALADAYGSTEGAYGLPADQITSAPYDRLADAYGSTEGAYGLPADQITPTQAATRIATQASVPSDIDRLADVYGSSEGAYGLPAEQIGSVPVEIREIPPNLPTYQEPSLASSALNLAEAGWGALPTWAKWGAGIAAVDALTGGNLADALTGKGGGGGGGLTDEQKAEIERLKELYGEQMDLLGYQRGRTGDPNSYARYGEIGGEHEFFTPREFIKLEPEPTPTMAATGGYMTSDSSLPYYRYGQMPMATGGPAYFKSGALAQGADGRSDDIPAVLSDGEYVFDAETVALLGNGSSDAGAQRLEQMRRQIRQHKGQNLARGDISPDARSPLSYLKGRA